MAIDCSDVPSNVAYDCANPWGVNCTSKFHFEFASLWNYTQNIQAACANDTRLFLPKGGSATAQNASLTQDSCAAIAGSGWTLYSALHMWTRVTTWKLPLLQLVASFPRPPLSFKVECLVIFHLLGDPIDTMKNLILKMSTCQRTAKHWKEKLLETLDQDESDLLREDRELNWKALAIITDAYGEWNTGGLAQDALDEALTRFPSNSDSRNDLMEVVRQTGRSLAADRSTKFLPIIVAQIFFIAAVAIALFRTTASAGDNAQGDTLYDKLQAHSIAFSAQYFWILPAVFLSSIIGVSQTEAAIPRILRRFQGDLDGVNLPEDHPGQPQRIQMPNDCLGDVQRRILRGGVYSWQPSSSTGSTSQPRPADNSHALLPYPVLLLGTVTGMLLSALVPPDGFNCRHAGEISMVTAWILSALADNILNRLWPLADAQPVGSNRSTIVLWVTIVKDFVMTFATMAGVVVMQIGIFNRCACYTRWGRVGLTLLERPDVAATLIHRLNTVYPAITFTSIGIELVIVPLYFCIRYCDALRVFIQRDDGQSNAPAWLRKACRKLQATQQRLLRLFPHLRFGPWKLKRIGTSRRASEEGRGPLAGGSHESHEMLRRTPSERQTHTPTGETRGAHGTHGSASQITPVSETESSGAELLPPSETSSPPKPEPRRRKSEPQCSTDDDKPLPNLPPDDKLIHRKPVSTASPLQHAHRDS